MNKEAVERPNEQLSTFGVMLPPNKSDILPVPPEGEEYTVQLFNLRGLYARDYSNDEVDILYDQYLETALDWHDSEENKARIPS